VSLLTRPAASRKPEDVTQCPSHGRPHAVSSGGSPSAPRRAALAFILVTVTLDMLAFGIVVPVLPKLVLDFTGGSATSAAWWQGVFGTVFAVIQFFLAPVLGALSDMGAGLASFALYGTAWPQ